MQQVVDKWAQETLDSKIDDAKDDDNDDDDDEQTIINIDILREMNQITASIIGTVAFDYEFTPEERNEFLDCLHTCWVEFGQKMGLNIFKQIPMIRLLFPGIRRAMAASKVMYDMCNKMLQEYRTRQAKNDAQQPHKLIHAIVNDSDYTDDSERLRDMVAFVIAGFDTTANTLAFAFREMALNPKLQMDLRQSVRCCDHNNNQLLKNTVKELLRMYPPAAIGSIRVVGTDTPIIGEEDGKKKYVIPKDGIVLMSYYGIQRNPQVYTDPDTFLPTRWENTTEDMTRCFLTFASGTRGCEGQPLAYAELHEVLSQLIEKYEFGIVEKGEPANLVLFKPVGTILSVKRAKNSK